LKRSTTQQRIERKKVKGEKHGLKTLASQREKGGPEKGRRRRNNVMKNKGEIKTRWIIRHEIDTRENDRTNRNGGEERRKETECD
jgi:hypothetical protein